MNAPFSLDNRMTVVLFAGMGGVPPWMIKLLAECNVRHAFAEAAE
ncbi:hypothetical protein [Mesorhizobium sp.]|nr:hypothetical protein [Mesorhizobium sp.]